MIYCLLPAYNEEKGISQQASSLNKFFESINKDCKLIIIDDGSTDRTLQEIERAKDKVNIELLIHKINMGPGAAFLTGFKHIVTNSKDNDVVVTMDSDNTMQLETIGEMLKKISEGYDVVLGSVFIKGGELVGVSFLRRQLAFFSNLIYSTVFPFEGVTCYTGFYRAMKGHALKTVIDKYGDSLTNSRGFGFMAELLLKFRLFKFSITEVPMTIRYDQKTSASKLKIIKTLKEHLNIIRRNLFYRGES